MRIGRMKKGSDPIAPLSIAGCRAGQRPIFLRICAGMAFLLTITDIVL